MHPSIRRPIALQASSFNFVLSVDSGHFYQCTQQQKKKYAASSSKWNDKQQIVEFVRDCKWSKKIFLFKIVIGSFDEIRCLVVLKVLRWSLAIWSFFFHCQPLWETKTAWAESPKYILKCHKKIPNEFQKPPKRRFFSCSAFIPTLSTIWNW